MEDNEKVITAWDVVETVFGIVYIVSGIVALFALIWAKWYTFRCAVTVIAALSILGVVAYYVSEKLSKR